MNEELMELLTNLNNKLKNHPLILEVKEAETKMENTEEFMRKVMILENITSEYNDAIRYNLPLNELQKKLFEAKYNLDSLDVVLNYREKYKIAQEYLDKVSKIIFNDISDKLKVNELL